MNNLNVFPSNEARRKQTNMINQLFKVFLVKSRVEYSRNKLYQAAYSWCHDEALAEDLVQETMLKALSTKSQLDDLKYLDTWLFRILINTWHDYLRKKKEVENFHDYVFASIDDVENDYLAGELISKVRQEISKLPVDLREVITLIDFSGFSYQEVSEIISIPIGTVMSRLYRARRSLEKNLLVQETHKTDISYLRKVT